MSIKQVQKFHDKFDLPLGGTNKMTPEAREFRKVFLQEELNEFVDANYSTEHVANKVDAFDALLDLAYVTYGTALFMGISPLQWDAGMAEVQRCNMAKERATTAEQSKRGTAFDVVKPQGWTGPEATLKKILSSSDTELGASNNLHVEAPVSKASTKELLTELMSRGGHPGEIAHATLVCLKKSEDYNHGKDQNPHDVDRSEYFPFGTASYAQMLHTKAQRFVSLTQKQLDGDEANFEGLSDTALDIINYAGFYLASVEGRTE